MDRHGIHCRQCGQAFDAQVKGRLPIYCPSCSIARSKATNPQRQARYRQRNLERIRESDRQYKAADRAKPGYSDRRREGWLRRKFGLTAESFAAMVNAQGGVCAICRNGHCGPGEYLHIDHCHDTGRIRGLLCGKCNTMIGLANNDPARLRAAAGYLTKYGACN